MKKYRLVILIVIVFLLTASFSVSLHNNSLELKANGDNLTFDMANVLGRVISDNIKSSLQRYENNLVSISNALNYMESAREQNRYLRQMVMRDTTAIYRITDYNGDMELLNSHESVNISDTDFFKTAIKGYGITATYDETVDDIKKRYIVIARPICSASNDFPTGIICEFIDTGLIIDSINVNIKDTQIMLTDKNSSIIAVSDSKFLSANNIKPLQSLLQDASFCDWINGPRETDDTVYLYTGGKHPQYITSNKLNNMGWTAYISMSSDPLSIDTSSYRMRTNMNIALYIFLLLLITVVYLLPVFKDINRKKIQESQSLMFANVSHELRTPLNTIIGVSEILSHSELNEGQLRQIAYISDSGKNLLAMINDLLDFSKLNSNKFELINESYFLEDIIYDTTTSATIRLAEKPIDYMVCIASYVPKQLIGDSLRVRQIFNNIISNAVKYTRKGHIITTIDCEYLDDDEIRLIVSVEDTGIGIKKEDIDFVFDNYTRLDTENNKHIEGTGLGMPIAKQFAKLMDGDITVHSIYHKGTVFTVNIKQKIASPERLMPEYNNNGAKKKILILEKSQLLSVHYSLCLEDAYADFYIADDNYEFSEKLSQNAYDFVLADPDTIAMLRDEMEFDDNVTLISLVKTTFNTGIQGATIYIPLFALEILSYLTGKELHDGRHTMGQPLKIFTMPEKRILIVDDNVMNLQVATGILEPYKMKIDTVSSGESAIDLVKNNTYDLILMDHMMPVMDGEETMNAIRQLDGGKYGNIPVIACTAGAASGSKETYINMGFSDFIAKPLDIYKLHELLYKWLTPDENAECFEYRHGDSVTSMELDSEDDEFIDFKEGLARIGSMPIYLKTLRNFCDTIPKKKDIISFSFPNDIKTFVVEVHGLKGVAAIVSANELARQSLTLEMMGKNEDIAGIEPLLDDYYNYMMDVKLSAEKFISDHT
ncbi:MAG: response regulator [Lachnospiraceae bacterium]|nr:response regulator [Lachnospiraceae bacterium]